MVNNYFNTNIWMAKSVYIHEDKNFPKFLSTVTYNDMIKFHT